MSTPVIDNTHIPYIKSAMDRIVKADISRLNPAPIKLREWLIDNKMTVPQLAMRTGFNPSSIYNYISGQPTMYPSLAQAFAIEWATGGYVQAWLWLDDSTIAASVRSTQLSAATRFEGGIKSFVLKYKSLTTNDGMLRHKARILSRLFGVDWGEVKKRCWVDAKAQAYKERADITPLMNDDRGWPDISQEEHDAQNTDKE